ncbi:MAG: ATP-binding protein [bacterium]|nr:ATP-binding protein [bacterium]
MVPLRNYRGNLRFWLKSYMLVGVVVLIFAIFFYTNRVINRMEEQSAATTRVFSRFIAEVVFEAQDPGKRLVLQEVIREIRLPIILTDVEGRPFAWHRVSIPEPADEDFNALLTMDPNNPPPGKISDLVAMVRKFDASNTPVEIRSGGDGVLQGYVHFGVSQLQRELRLMPFIQFGLVLLFMSVAFQGLRALKLSEQRSIWVGMAKETAHQLGTPLSALLGWIQMLKDQAKAGSIDDLNASVREMEEDLKRLSKVTERFSKIGSEPEFKNVNISEVLDRTVRYFHRRLPRLKADSTISLDMDESPFIRGNEELLEWVFENLIKNGLDALGEKGGAINIRSRYDAKERRVDVFVEDTGRGVPPALRRQIFSPGFTTKKRGWGLGLALTRRIVEEYHGGELRLSESRVGKGSTFRVGIPVP